MTAPVPAAGRLRRRLLFAALYFAEGAPIGFVWWALPVWLRSAGTGPGDVARLLALVAWPWALKFLWAPLVDLLRGPRFGLRAWILLSQAGMALTLLPFALRGFDLGVSMLTAVLLAHAVAAATQDAAIDSLAIGGLDPDERGAVNGWMQAGMLAARGLFGGGALLLAPRVGEQAVVWALIVATLGPGLLLLRSSALARRPVDTRPRRERLAGYTSAFGAMLRSRPLWVGFAYASVAGAGFESLASLAGPLLLDRGASEDAVGFFFLIPVVVLMACGALLGGRLADRHGRRRMTVVGEALAATTVLAIGALSAWAPTDLEVDAWFALLGLLYFAAGMATAALYALLMDLVDPALAATQFCVFMAGINLCYVWSTASLGSLVDRWGYGPAIAALGFASLLALPLLGLLTPRPANALPPVR